MANDIVEADASHQSDSLGESGILSRGKSIPSAVQLNDDRHCPVITLMSHGLMADV